MVLFDFRLFSAQIHNILHQIPQITHEIPPEPQNIFQIRPKKRQNRPSRTPPPATRFFDFFLNFSSKNPQIPPETHKISKIEEYWPKIVYYPFSTHHL
jgi:hypothetical protein